MKIYVRRRHIEMGVPEVACKCPIALAVIDAVGGHVHVAYEDFETNGEQFHLPRPAQRFITRFDSGKPVKPFAFTIRA